jgi:hypothetical protein
MGPFQLKSLAGNTYVIHFTDLESKYRVIYFMKSKEETKEMIERFYDHVKELGHELSILKRDNGTEFVNEGQRICEREVYTENNSSTYSASEWNQRKHVWYSWKTELTRRRRKFLLTNMFMGAAAKVNQLRVFGSKTFASL